MGMGQVRQNCDSKVDYGRSPNAIDLLAGAFKDHAVVFIAEPEPGFSKVVELGAHGGNETSLFGQAVDARRSNHVRSRRSREPDSITVVHQQRLGTKFRGEHDGVALARMQAGQAKPVRLRSFPNLPYGKP